MNKVGMASKELYEADQELADEYVKVGERLAAEHDVWYECKRFAEQCHRHADAIRPFAARHESVARPTGRRRGRRDDDRRPAAQALRGSRASTRSGPAATPVAPPALPAGARGLLPLIIAGQLAQATRDQELLTLVDDLHRETLTQIKWLKAQVKQASPQALVVGAGS